METLVWYKRGVAVIGLLSFVTQPAIAGTATGKSGATCLSRHVDAQATRIEEPVAPASTSLLTTTGSVRVRVDLDETGTLKRASIVASSGNPALDRAALEAVRRSEFSPEKIDCNGVAGSYAVDVDFTE